jgi:hypothetical protein
VEENLLGDLVSINRGLAAEVGLVLDLELSPITVGIHCESGALVSAADVQSLG